MRSGDEKIVRFPGLTIIHHSMPGQRVKPHSHSEHQFIFPLRGEFHLFCSGQKMVSGPGQMIYIPAKLEHEFLATNLKEGERVICMISPRLWGAKTLKMKSVVHVKAGSALREILFYLLLNPTRPSAKALAKNIALVLKDDVKAALMPPLPGSLEQSISKLQEPRLKIAVAYMRDHFSDPNLNIRAIAKIAGLSPRNLSRFFRTQVGASPGEALTDIRLHEAKRLLTQSMLPITEVSLMVGYRSLSHFIRAFQKAFESSPSAIRRGW